ncbi:hypothetical protein [Bremerella alba]|uniref:HEAT repeat domain-containing protein n=1 Tax=Bremerella alba TaxID=980252 RepID=A0A7V8V396_9BACT|nr:hypothetical protein [Bremerella alba]MBA2114090.1 hypothetical protein [Bremerella alba]
MNADSQKFISELPNLLRLLAVPTTTHTAPELWNRIDAFGWEECYPVLLGALESNDSDVKQLVLSVICYAADTHGNEFVQPFESVVLALLEDEDRLVRMSAVLAVESLRAFEPEFVAALRFIVGYDEPILASQALITLLELDIDRSVILELAPLFRK